MKAVPKAGKDVKAEWVLKARTRSKGWSHKVLGPGGARKGPELAQAADGAASQHQGCPGGLKDHRIRRLQSGIPELGAFDGP